MEDHFLYVSRFYSLYSYAYNGKVLFLDYKTTGCLIHPEDICLLYSYLFIETISSIVHWFHKLTLTEKAVIHLNWPTKFTDGLFLL